MSNEKVTWELKAGISSLLNLQNIVQLILTQLKKENIIKTFKKSAGERFMGYYLNDNNFWIGIFYVDPEKIYFEYLKEFTQLIKDEKVFSEMKESPDGNPSKYYDFNETYFLAFSKEDQKKAINDFIKKSLEFTENLLK